jgi:ribonuclease T1
MGGIRFFPRVARVGTVVALLLATFLGSAVAADDSICYANLSPQASNTIQLIEQGGPFPYSKDGTVFQNREGILPDQPTGYYHEYTVNTPGSSNRGARRIVTGEAGQEDYYYYTDDHYATFDLVDFGC